MKKTLLASAFILAFSTVAFAAPLTDYSQGKVTADVSVRPSTDLGNYKDSNNLEYGVTAGLGNNFAIQYKNSDTDSKKLPFSSNYQGTIVTGTMKGELKAQELNLLYQLNDNVSAFVGLTQAKMGLSHHATGGGITVAGNIAGKSANGMQIGFVTTEKLADRLNGYTMLALGNKVYQYELGVSYEVSKDVDFNVFYKSTKYKNLTLQSAEFDANVKGIGYGLTAKF